MLKLIPIDLKKLTKYLPMNTLRCKLLRKSMESVVSHEFEILLNVLKCMKDFTAINLFENQQIYVITYQIEKLAQHLTI